MVKIFEKIGMFVLAADVTLFVCILGAEGERNADYWALVGALAVVGFAVGAALKRRGIFGED